MYSATITKINFNDTNINNNHNNNDNNNNITNNGSPNSSLSSISSNSSSLLQQSQQQLQQQQQKMNSVLTSRPEILNLQSSSTTTTSSFEKENDSGIEKDDSNTIFIRISINDQNLQKVLKFNLDESIWSAKHRVLSTLVKEIKDGLNYGFYMPPYQGRAGKFLDDCRLLREYSLIGPVAHLEFKYKKRVYKFVKINQKELKALNVKSNYKRFLDLVRTNQVAKVNRFLEKGLDPNFHSDLGETPLTIAASLADPRSMIMTLYNGGAHLDFRSRDTLTPMHKSAMIGNDKALKALLELGAFAEVRDGRMLTPLFYSVVNSSSVQSIEYLLFNGSTLGVRDDNNWQEIHHACKLGLSQHLDHLIYYGSDVNAHNNSGNTPLHVCAIHNQENCARILLFRGANRHERNLANQTAYETAIIAGNQIIADLIKNHRDTDVVLIRERPFYNTKRRSIYINDSQSNYSMSINGSLSGCLLNQNNYSASLVSRQTSLTTMNSNCDNNNKSTLTSSATANTLIDWNNNKNNNNNSSTAVDQSSSLASKSRSMPKLDDFSTDQNNLTLEHEEQQANTTAINSKQLPNDLSSSSPHSSRSRSISSDDHGFGSASLSQLSGSPKIEYAYARKRLYPSIPNRTFICVKPFKPTQPGELELKKGDIIELLSVGDSGYWEGRCGPSEGWFKANCVEEFQVPKNDDLTSDSIVLKRKTLIDLITHNNNQSNLKTVVLQRGKKGFGFVLRGAKINDAKFEPTLEVPALQFLESVEKDSNAHKAGLRPLDFVLEINGIDVSCKTHLDCVKIIKKTGDTLALKVYTVDYTTNKSNSNTNNQNSSNMISTSTVIYQTPIINSNTITNPKQYSTSASYYATSAITPNNHHHHHHHQLPAITTSAGIIHSSDYFDGTKSLPNKKKPVPPRRDPNTSLTASQSQLQNQQNYSGSGSSSPCSLSSMSSCSTNRNACDQSNDDVCNKTKNSFASFKQNCNQNHHKLSSNNTNSPNSILSNPVIYSTINTRHQDQVSHSDPESGQKPNENFMNSILAQIDELDKTLAEYDTNSSATTATITNINTVCSASVNQLNSSLSNRILANDANAASIRTRVPVRKPGINNGEIFKQPIMGLHQKTMSVPNLNNSISLASPPPPPPPPPPPLAPPSFKSHIYSSPNNSNDTTLTYQINTYQPRFVKASSLGNGVQNSASNDTLVQDEHINFEIDDSNTNQLELDCPIDYDQNNYDLESYDDKGENFSLSLEPPIDYDQSRPASQLSTFPNSKPNQNSNLIMMLNSNSMKGSPLTPRQIKQRNCAKRNSIPSSVINGSCSSLKQVDSFNSASIFTPQQQADLVFLQSQKFDAEFMQTTKDLFLRYPNAKISISVTVSSYQTNPNSQQQIQTEQTTRQIEIDRAMFEKINSCSIVKIQPQTPARTTSTLTGSSIGNGSNYNSYSSSSPSSSSSSSSAYDTASINLEPVKSDDLSEAIKKAADEFALKRPTSEINSRPEANTTSSYRKPPIQNVMSVKNELERALEVRLRKTNESVVDSSQNNDKNRPSFISNNVILASTDYQLEAPKRQPVPPPPPPPLPAFGFSNTAPATKANIMPKPVVKIPSGQEFPPPPSPQQLHRLIEPASGSNKTIINVKHVNNSSNNNNNNFSNNNNNCNVVDPRLSSDFGALIAKKAAEKCAKFQETKPSANKVTFQPDGSKIYTTSIIQKNEASQIPIDQQVRSLKQLDSPIKLSNQVNKMAATFNNNNVNRKPVFINTNHHIKPSANNMSKTYFSSNEVSSSSQTNELPIETVDQENEMNNTSSNRNESFINTAAKLLEKAKQNHQLNQMEELNTHEKTKQDIIQQQNGNIFKKSEELVQN